MATWKDWKGTIPEGFEGAQRTRITSRTGKIIENVHIAPRDGCVTLCGKGVEDEDDYCGPSEYWKTEKEIENIDLPPFPDDLKACRICNARMRKLTNRKPTKRKPSKRQSVLFPAGGE